jgi:transposase-like protein
VSHAAGERAVPFHCPYCGDGDLWPGEEGHGAWECHACLRAFSLRSLGLVRPQSAAPGVQR